MRFVMQQTPLFFQGWQPIARVFIGGIAGFVCLVVFLRLAGKRALSKMNVFDFVIIVAFGSTLATTVLGTGVTITEGILAMGLLVLIQFTVSRLTVVSRRFEHVVNGYPVFLMRHGRFLADVLKHEHVTQEEVMQAIRAQGLQSLEDVDSVVLETDGTYSVIHESSGPATALGDVRHDFGRARERERSITRAHDALRPDDDSEREAR